MKAYCQQNPQYNSRTLSNLPSINSFSSYLDYQKEKKQRKEIAKKRKQLEQTVLTLRRKAEESNKRFQESQSDLMSVYNKKLQTLDYTNKKNQYKKQQQDQLEKRRNLSSLARYLHIVKKQSALKELSEKNKSISRFIKQQVQQANSKKKQEKSLYMISLIQRNKKMNQTNRSQAKWAKEKSLEQKHKLSRTVRNQLINIQSERISRQNQAIMDLEQQKRNILNLLRKNDTKHNSVQQMKQEILNMNLQDFQQRMVNNKQQSRVLHSHLSSRVSTKSKKKRQSNKNRASLYY